MRFHSQLSLSVKPETETYLQDERKGHFTPCLAWAVPSPYFCNCQGRSLFGDIENWGFTTLHCPRLDISVADK